MRLPRLVLIASLIAGCATAGQTRINSGGAADFTLAGVDGVPVTLSEHLGQKVILLNFWATWCGPCMSEMPHLQALYERHKADGLLVLGIAMDGPEGIANVAPAIRRQSITYPVLLDEETRVVGLYNPRRAAPFNVLIDRSGRVVKSAEGYNPGDEKTLEQAVLALLGEAAPAQSAEATSR